MAVSVYAFSHHVPRDRHLGHVAKWYVNRLEKDYALRVDDFSYPAWTGDSNATPHQRSSRHLLNRIVREVGILNDQDALSLHVETDTIFIIKRSST